MAITKMSSKGQIVIPVEMRKGIEEGEKLEEVRSAHREHCVEVMAECAADYPDDKEAQLAMFNHRCDKIFSWIQQALDEKVRNKRQ